jgi:hypothetical protein
MTRLYVFLLSFTLFHTAIAGERVIFNVSKPMCLLIFLEASAGVGQVSPALQQYMAGHITRADVPAVQRLGREFFALNLNTGYNFPGYPERRQYARKVLDLVSMAAIQSSTLDEFAARITGLLPNEQCLALQKMMVEAEPIYTRMIGGAPDKAVAANVATLQQYAAQCGEIVGKLKAFYGSTWGSEPFLISLYPVPGSSGTTTATPHSSCVEVGALTHLNDHALTASVAIHEICHVLFGEEPLAWQVAMDSLFMNDASAYRLYACNYIDEALATACANGWAYKALTGREDTGSWYADAYINGYAHALYPLVTGYIERGKTVDKAFVAEAIKLFAATFPNSIFEYKTMLNRINLYTDADNDAQYRTVTNTLNKYFNINGCAGSYPIADPQALELIDQSANTQLFLVYANHTKNYEALKTKFPQIKNEQPEKEGIISFFDSRQRPVVIVNAHGMERLDAAIAALSGIGKMNKDRMFTALEP